ncbi:MAG: sugar phosphate isomerase/epimerase [Planctomycetota bacterium]|nr:sugar phosphate isomerase/epimerase [Planctomycetota bacterium]
MPPPCQPLRQLLPKNISLRVYNTDYDSCIRKAATLGFDSVGLRGTGIVGFADEKKKATRELADSLGVTLNYVAACGADLASESGEERAVAVGQIGEILGAVASMGGTLVCGAFYAPWKGTLPAGVVDKRPNLERSARAMREICRRADGLGIRINLEILNRYENYLLNTASEGLEYLEAAGCGNLGPLLDTFHMNIEEETLPGAIRAAGDRLGHFHIGEANRDVPGPGGHIPWPEVFAAIRDIGYPGIVEFEPFVTNGSEIAANIRPGDFPGEQFPGPVSGGHWSRIRGHCRKRGRTGRPRGSLPPPRSGENTPRSRLPGRALFHRRSGQPAGGHGKR